MVVESAAGRGKSSLVFGDDLLCDLPFPRASDSGGLGSAELTCQFQLWLIVVRFFQTLPQAGALRRLFREDLNPFGHYVIVEIFHASLLFNPWSVGQPLVLPLSMEPWAQLAEPASQAPACP